ncbi:MAG TPA: hypothetical protein VM409_08185 [Chloroflexia bacterium]|nr:hypothetical protein [Chloroflexia bacterium]
MTLLAVIILRVFAWLVLGIGVVTTILLIFASRTLLPAGAPLPNNSLTAPLALLTLLQGMGLLFVTFFWWALLICVASIADDLHAIRYRQQ